jgi:tetratricopeptide (TPR) repeat protein
MSGAPMRCEQFRAAIVDDDEAVRRDAERHASVCPTCGAIARADAELARRVGDWQRASPAPSAALEQRVLTAVRLEVEARRVVRWHMPAAWPAPAWAAAGAIAATLVIGAILVVREATLVAAPQQADRLLVVDALREAEEAERRHAEAIARLERAARPILAKASDPALAAEHAARLMALANQLRFLDETIAEIDSFLQTNSGHPGARTTLLAAYVEKTEVLREIIALDREITS